jgi:type II secretory pathway pseudopilin PulG
MKYRSDKILLTALLHNKAFSLTEVVVALVLLGFVCSAVFVVINCCMASAADLSSRMQAFEVARDNMEKLLASDGISEMVDYGSSDKYPEIQWQTTVETFFEPEADRVWLQGVCSADYVDTSGNTQTIKLTHWLTEITKEQLIEIIKEKQKELDRLGEQYKAGQETAEPDEKTLAEADQEKTGQDQDKTVDKQDQDKTGSEAQPKEGEQKFCGYTIDELIQMPFSQFWQVLSNCKEF